MIEKLKVCPTAPTFPATLQSCRVAAATFVNVTRPAPAPVVNVAVEPESEKPVSAPDATAPVNW